MKMQGTLLLLSLATQAFAASCTSYDISVASQGEMAFDIDSIVAIAHSPDFQAYEVRTAASLLLRKIEAKDFDSEFDDLLNNNDQICGWQTIAEASIDAMEGMDVWGGGSLESITLADVESESTSGCSCRNMVWTLVFVTNFEYEVNYQEDEANNPVIKHLLLALPSKSVSTTKTTTFSRVYDGFDSLEMLSFADTSDPEDYIVAFHSGYLSDAIFDEMGEEPLEKVLLGAPANIPRVIFTPTESASVGLTSWWSLFSRWF